MTGVDRIKKKATQHKHYTRKAPGPNGIPTEVIKHTISITLQLLLSVLNNLLKDQEFLDIWKTSKLMLMP